MEKGFVRFTDYIGILDLTTTSSIYSIIMAAIVASSIIKATVLWSMGIMVVAKLGIVGHFGFIKAFNWLASLVTVGLIVLAFINY